MDSKTSGTRSCLFIWTIPNYSSGNDLHFKSPEYNVEFDREDGTKMISKWRLTSSIRSIDVLFRSLYLELISSNSEDAIEGKMEFSIIDGSHVHHAVRHTGHRFDPDELDWGYRQFIRKTELTENLLMKDGALQFCCSLEIKTSSSSDDNESAPVQSDGLPQAGTSYDIDHRDVLWRGFMNEKHTDVTFQVGEEGCKADFKLHKVVMSGCPVFSAMFDSQLKEARENLVTITDVEPQVFKEIIRYIYTGHVENLKDLATKLIVTADKYCVEGLVQLCQIAIKENLSVENAAATLSLAKFLGAEKLEEHAKRFIQEHPMDVVKHESFETCDQDLLKHISFVLAEGLAKKK